MNDGIRTDDVTVSLGDQEEKGISLESHVVLEPIVKLVEGRWVGASHDISMSYSEDFTKLYLKNRTGCAEPLSLKVRLIKLDRKR